MKTYLTGVLLGVLLLVVWNTVRSGGQRQNAGGAGVPSPPAQQGQPDQQPDQQPPTADDPTGAARDPADQ